MGINLDYSGTGGDRPSDSGVHANDAPRTLTAASRPRITEISRNNLIEIIEGEIIPKLFLAYRNRTPHPLATPPSEAGELADHIFLAQLFLVGDAAALTSRLQSLLDNGMQRERVYLDLLAPMPRTLSQFWAEGRCSFDEMAIGLCCVDDVLRDLHRMEHATTQP